MTELLFFSTQKPGFLKMHVPQNSDKIRLWGAKVMWVLEIENFTILKLKYKKPKMLK